MKCKKSLKRSWIKSFVIDCFIAPTVIIIVAIAVGISESLTEKEEKKRLREWRKNLK